MEIDAPTNSPSTTRTIASASVLVLANLLTLVGALALDWDALQIVLVYVSQTAVIGVITVLRIFTAGIRAPAHRAGNPVGTALFFVIHYGMFVTIQTLLVLAFLASQSPLVDEWVDRGFGPRSLGLAVGAAVFAVHHGISFYVNYLRGGERHYTTPKKEMERPYVRIFIQQIVVIGGAIGMTMMELGDLSYVVLLVLLKTGIDLWRHAADHGPGKQLKRELFRERMEDGQRKIDERESRY